jgi:hypothetical protein
MVVIKRYGLDMSKVSMKELQKYFNVDNITIATLKYNYDIVKELVEDNSHYDMKEDMEALAHVYEYFTGERP